MEKPKIVIVLEGGLVQHIVADQEMDVTVLDFDTEGIDEKHSTEVNGDEAYVTSPHLEIDPDEVESINDQIKENGPSDD